MIEKLVETHKAMGLSSPYFAPGDDGLNSPRWKIIETQRVVVAHENMAAQKAGLREPLSAISWKELTGKEPRMPRGYGHFASDWPSDDIIDAVDEALHPEWSLDRDSE
jgi:hypothetical protein